MILLAKEEGLPYIPFRIVFVEGTLVPGGESSGNDPNVLDMTPVWLSLSECDNIVFYKGLTNLRDNSQSLTDILNNKKYKCSHIISELKKFNKSKVEIISVDEDDDDVEVDNKDTFKLGIYYDLVYDYKCIRYDLKICKPDVSNADIIKDIQKRDPILNTLYYPRQCDIVSSNPYFSINQDGKMLLFGEQCVRAIEILKKLDFEQAIKSKLNNINFTLPQEKAIINENFCNESVYGNCKVLFVSGLIKIETTPNSTTKHTVKTIDEQIKLKKELACYLLNSIRNDLDVEEYNLLFEHINNINSPCDLNAVFHLLNKSFCFGVPINDKILTDKINDLAKEEAILNKIFND